MISCPTYCDIRLLNSLDDKILSQEFYRRVMVWRNVQSAFVKHSVSDLARIRPRILLVRQPCAQPADQGATGEQWMSVKYNPPGGNRQMMRRKNKGLRPSYHGLALSNNQS
ncbi:hypothetical protein RRG08_030916 [Elysia crispata]|uniref:Uncharacterized protein n=1 Tax=Elysia crispata TaxID=231223 RepID=A0AAE1DVR0_9GAST|nr:hypothetical protein RRG08_030916 [Elysia crispata]